MASNGDEAAKKLKDMLAKLMSPRDISKARNRARECVKK